MLTILKKDIKYLFISPDKIEYAGFFNNLKLVFFYYFILILVLSFSSAFIAVISHLFSDQTPPFLNRKVSFFQIAVIAPIVEEVLFRLIIRANKFNLILFFIFLPLFVLYENLMLPAVPYYIVVLLFFFILLFKKDIHKTDRQPNSNFFSLSFLIYSSSIFFGMIHLLNFTSINTIGIMVIAYTVSKILGGFVFALLRLKFGITASIILHVFLNSITYLMVF